MIIIKLPVLVIVGLTFRLLIIFNAGLIFTIITQFTKPSVFLEKMKSTFSYVNIFNNNIESSKSYSIFCLAREIFTCH